MSITTRSDNGQTGSPIRCELALGLETSQTVGTISLARNGSVLENVALESPGQRHAQSLVSEADRLLRRHGHEPSQLTLIAVSIGPGSFTGLRVGVVLAKTLAYALSCRVVAVDTLLAIAANSPPDVTEVVVAADAQRGEFFAGRYRAAASDGSSRFWERTAPIAIVSATELCQQLVTPADSRNVVALSGPAADALGTMLPESVRRLDASCRVPRADMIAQLGERLAARGDFTDPWTLEPFYLRRSAAEEKASRSNT